MLFISCYYNPCGYKIREKVSREFMNRYEDKITMYEYIYGEFKPVFEKSIKIYKKIFQGFEQYELINKLGKETDKAVCYIDCNCILPDNFFNITIHEDRFAFMSPYNFINDIPGAIAFNNIQFHSGVAYVFNNKFLKSITLPNFPMGGMDHILMIGLFRDIHLLNKIMKVVKHDLINFEIIEFYNALSDVDTLYMPFKIEYIQHGKLQNRNYEKRWTYYRLGISPMDYFKMRAEDD
jgi:hypothetical protein